MYFSLLVINIFEQAQSFILILKTRKMCTDLRANELSTHEHA